MYNFFVQARIWRLAIQIASGFRANDFRKKWHVRNDVYGLVKWFIMNELSSILCSPCTLRHFVPCFAPFHRVKCHRLCARLPQIMHLFTITHFTLNYQQHQHSSLPFKQLAPFPWLTTPLPLRGGAGGEASFALPYFPFNYPPRHTHNCFTTQLGTSCTFDSPGLASESEVYPGFFAVRGNNAVGVVPFIPRHFIMAFHIENVQHLRR